MNRLLHFTLMATTLAGCVDLPPPSAFAVQTGPSPTSVCLDSALCLSAGACVAVGKQCVVDSDADCALSTSCTTDGHCHVYRRPDGIAMCAATTQDDCTNADRCHKTGACTLAPTGLGCID